MPAIWRTGPRCSATIWWSQASPARPKNAHTFLSNIDVSRLPLAVVQLAFAAQTQIATFFSSRGTTVIDPDGGLGPIFEVPVALPLPEALNFIP